ncbi:MAG: histidine phosphatase family protein [Roseobacter sp.]
MIKLALLRHGHTEWNRAGKIQGRTDIPLDAAARAHLAQFHLPTPWDKAALVSSPLGRAVETAKLVGGKSPETDPALIEMDWGAWEGQHGENLLVTAGSGYRHIEEWGWDYRPPNGESPHDVLVRLLPWVAALSQDTIAVCHIGIMRVLMAHAMQWPFQGPAPFRIKRDRLFILEIQGQNWHANADPLRLQRHPS